MNENHLVTTELSAMRKIRYATLNKELQQENKVLKSQINKLHDTQTENIILKNENEKLKNIIKDFYHQSVQKLVGSTNLRLDQSIKFINDIVDKISCSHSFREALKNTFKKPVKTEKTGLEDLVRSAKSKAKNNNQNVKKTRDHDIER